MIDLGHKGVGNHGGSYAHEVEPEVLTPNLNGASDGRGQPTAAGGDAVNSWTNLKGVPSSAPGLDCAHARHGNVDVSQAFANVIRAIMVGVLIDHASYVRQVHEAAGCVDRVVIPERAGGIHYDADAHGVLGGGGRIDGQQLQTMTETGHPLIDNKQR